MAKRYQRNRPQPHARSRRLVAERLETRQLLAADFVLLNYGDNASASFASDSPYGAQLASFSSSSLVLSNSQVSADALPGTSIGSFTTAEVPTNPVTWSLVSGTGDTDNAKFQIVGNVLISVSTFDFGTQQSFSIRVRAAEEAGLPLEDSFSISLVQGVASIVEDPVPGGGINPGSSNSNPSNLRNVNGTLYFRANDGTNGNELWRISSSGIAEMVEDAVAGGGINPGSGSSDPRDLTNVNGTLYFTANDGTNGDELWRINSSGVAQLVEDAVAEGGINSGSNGSNPRYLTNVNGTLYFRANDGTNGNELWRISSSGIAEVVEDAVAGGGINPGSSSSYPRYLTNVNGTLYFRAIDGTNGNELWRINSSGIAEMIEDAVAGGGIRPGYPSSDPSYLRNVNGTLYFRANDGTNGNELWRINSSGVAEMIEDAVAGGGINPGSSGSSPLFLTNVNGTLYFLANDGTNGSELWRINSSGMAEMVEDAVAGGGIRPGNSNSFPKYLTNVNGTLYFNAIDGTNGEELWRINSSGVAQLVEDAVAGGGIRPGNSGSYPTYLTNVNGTLYFRANDGTNGNELWRINSSGVAEMVEDAVAGGGISPGSSSSSPSQLTAIGDQLYFVANDGFFNGQELWTLPLIASPTDLSLSSQTIAENQPSLTNIGTFTTTDPQANDSFTYTLVPGTGDTDNGNFTIAGDQLTMNVSPDFETKSSYSIRVRTTDSSGLTLEKQFTINVTNVNEIPTAVNVSAASIAENSLPNNVIGTISSLDPDVGDSFTYTLVTGTGDADNAAFTITGDQLSIIASPDFESKPSYSVRIRTTDQDGLFTEQDFVISVTDVNEVPTAIALTANSIAENAPAGSTVGTFSTTDPDAGNTFTYSFVTGTGDTDNGAFTITGNQLTINASPDFEAKSSYSVRIRTTDQDGLSTERSFTISVTNLAEDLLADRAAAQWDFTENFVIRESLYENFGGWNERWIYSSANLRWYFITPFGQLYRWQGGSNATSVQVAQLSPEHYLDPALLTSAANRFSQGTVEQTQVLTARLRSVALDQRYQFQTVTNDHFNWGGANERWLRDRTGLWYFIKPDAINNQYTLHQLVGGSVATSPMIAQLSIAEYTDLSLLYNAQENYLAATPNDVPTLTAETVDRELGLRFNGSYYAAVGGLNAKWMYGALQRWYFLTSDGSLYQWTGSYNLQQNIKIAKVDPALHGTPALLHNAYQPPTQLVTLDTTLQFLTRTAYTFNWGGLQEKWLLTQPGTWYYLKPNGELYRWNGGSRANIAANSTLIATLGVDVYHRPHLLTDAAS